MVLVMVTRSVTVVMVRGWMVMVLVTVDGPVIEAWEWTVLATVKVVTIRW